MDGGRLLRKGEIALLAALSISLLLGAWAQAAGAGVSDAVRRLHVVACSDEAAEQAVKLEVRDAVLEYLTPLLGGAGSRDGAAAVIGGHLDGIEAAARSAAGGREVAVELGEEYYPTREYGGFALPAGRYQSLRVTLGEGEGHNWWCVVFPPLCLDSSGAEEAFGQLDAPTRGIITEPARGVTFRFRLVELWGELMEFLRTI